MILLILFVLDTVTQTVLIAALGASTFIAFTMPHTTRSQPRFLIGGYCVGVLVGCTFSVLAASQAVTATLDPHIAGIVFAAAATGVAALVMVVTDTEHPPAAALALGFVLNDWSVVTVGVVLGGIVAIALFKQTGRRFLIDLL
jgi:CBS-domain-containing membrane protein